MRKKNCNTEHELNICLVFIRVLVLQVRIPQGLDGDGACFADMHVSFVNLLHALDIVCRHS